MAVLTGEVVSLNSLESMMHPVGQIVFARKGRKTIGSGTVGDDNQFTIELPDEPLGEIEVVLGMHNAAPSLVDFDGTDLHVTVLYSNVNNFIA